jgi:putative sigma-54 modulation protein
MNVEITARHCTLPEELKERAESRMRKMLRFDERIQDARLVVSLEKSRFNVDALVLASGHQIMSHAEEETDRGAIEQVLDRLEAQVRRHRDRVVKRKKGGPALGEMAPAGPVAPAAEEAPAVFGDDGDLDGLVSEDPGELDVAMPLAEALAMLRASRRDVLGFTNPDTSRITFLFKRRDGQIGVVDVV